MYIWSKRLVIGLLAAFGLLLILFVVEGQSGGTSTLKMHTTRWITLNYAGLVLWVFVWMIDQARVRGHNVWLWLPPFLFAPLPTLMAFVLFLQRPMKP
ncbi:MAG: hypothetical protein KGI53_02775 [Nitrospirota bacterium]|nr:hypothetical protein [Nitrospirota bacterium]